MDADRPRCVVADPGWRPRLHQNTRGRWEGINGRKGPQGHYTTMPLRQILELPPPLTQPRAHLWLWCLSQHIDWGYLLARAWGFEPQIAVTWAKPGLGMGRFQSNTEHLLACRKGGPNGNAFGHTGGTWFNWPKPPGRKHSAKPDAAYALIERVSPGPYHEMFARHRRPGWTAEGDQLEAAA
jgi:N6-adenosine-specific RNA methylase IME4